jgi:hypothetical protein
MLAFDAHCRQIPNSQLTLADIPGDGASAEELREFALSFNGYDYWGSDEVYTKVAHAGLHGNLTEMRTWLFFLSESFSVLGFRTHAGRPGDPRNARPHARIRFPGQAGLMPIGATAVVV